MELIDSMSGFEFCECCDRYILSIFIENGTCIDCTFEEGKE